MNENLDKNLSGDRSDNNEGRQENLENIKKERPSEKPEYHKKFVEIETFLIGHFKGREIEWIDHHADTYRNWFDEDPEYVVKKYEENPNNFFVEFQAQLDVEDDEGE